MKEVFENILTFFENYVWVLLLAVIVLLIALVVFVPLFIKTFGEKRQVQEVAERSLQQASEAYTINSKNDLKIIEITEKYDNLEIDFEAAVESNEALIKQNKTLSTTNERLKTRVRNLKDELKNPNRKFDFKNIEEQKEVLRILEFKNPKVFEILMKEKGLNTTEDVKKYIQEKIKEKEMREKIRDEVDNADREQLFKFAKILNIERLPNMTDNALRKRIKLFVN